MPIPSALQNAETDRDDATELVPPIALVIESDEDEATAATDGGLLLENHPGLIPQTAPVPAPEALSPRIPTPERPVPELDQVVLKEDNVRLLRENTELRRQLEALQEQLAESEAALRSLQSRSNTWQDESEIHAEILREVMRERDHFRAFSQASLWKRLRGCPPMSAALLGPVP